MSETPMTSPEIPTPETDQPTSGEKSKLKVRLILHGRYNSWSGHPPVEKVDAMVRLIDQFEREAEAQEMIYEI